MDAKKRYNDAVNCFTDKLKGDPNIIAVLLAGSLAYDQVWDKSDVDMTVIVRDQQLSVRSFCVDEDNIIINVGLITRTEFKQMLGRSRGGGIQHSIAAKGKIIYTTDESLYEALEEFKQLGSDDIEMSFFKMACFFIGTMEKVEKWLTIKEDPMYAQYYILKAADLLANMELIRNGEIPTRESVLRLAEINPELAAPFYQIPLSKSLSRQEIIDTLEIANNYLSENTVLLSRPALEYLEDGEMRTVTELTKRFEIDPHGITHIFDFLAEQGVIEKVSQTIRITPKGKKAVEEVAYIYIGR